MSNLNTKSMHVHNISDCVIMIAYIKPGVLYILQALYIHIYNILQVLYKQ